MDRPSNSNGSQDSPKKLDLVCFSHLPWDFVFQRPQHLLTRASRSRRVIYVEEPDFDTKPAYLDIHQYGNVMVVKPMLQKGLSKQEDRRDHIALIDRMMSDLNVGPFIAWYYTPMALGFTEHLQPMLTVYDNMDNLAAFNGAPKLLQAYEEELLRRADLVFTGGYSLFEAMKDKHEKVYAFPSSIEVEHFKQARQFKEDEEPVDQFTIPHPRLGYFGVIDERMDRPLIAALAEAHPDWHIVLVGPVAKVELKDLPVGPNIHYLGNKPYRDLPEYLAGWNVALLPFADNQSTQYISPTKTPEYLAGGKPVVSTPIRDVVRPYGEEGYVRIAHNPDEFIDAVEETLNGDWDREGWLEKVDQMLAQNSWDQTWKQMEDLIEKELNRPQEHPVKPSSTPLETKKASNGRRNGHAKAAAFDYLIVGAGFAGSVLAERLAVGSGKRVLLIDKRPHIGGNAFDHYNDDGILIHKYGPHIFHTNSKEVFTYLSHFTEWRRYEHRVLASVDGLLVPMPINLDTINKLYGTNYNSFEVEQFYERVAEPREKILTSEDVVVSKVGRELYQKFFRNYTRKQWDLDPSELDASVTSRVPIRMNRDDRYFTDTYQAMPLYGYTRMFERILDHPNIKVMLNTDYHELLGLVPYREMIFTGPVDEYFDYAYGKLPYRSLDFQFETLNEELHQPAAVINYPNEHLYTRVTEFKYLTGQLHPKTTLVYEYPTAVGDPYYPIPRAENAALYAKYQKLAESTPGVYFAGRLATYKYYNMDQVTAQALKLYEKIVGVKRGEGMETFTPKFIPIPVTGEEKEKKE